MSNGSLNRIYAVFLKDIKSEFRTRYAISAVLLFILTTITMILFSTAREEISMGVNAGLLWIIMFFGAMTGLSKSFVSEEERGTYLLLKLTTNPASVYYGKLLFNMVLNLTINTFAVVLFLLFSGSIEIKSYGVFVITILLGSFGIASASTIISAIIAKANTKGAIFPVLSFPLLLPLIIIGIEATKMSFDGATLGEARNNFQLMIAYSGIVIAVSYILFDQVWSD